MLALASVVGVTALIAGGCGSSKSSSTTGTSGTTTTTASSSSTSGTSPSSSTSGSTSGTAAPSVTGTTGSGVNEAAATPTGTPFNLGYICLCSSLNQSATLSPDVLNAWIKWQNLHDGINGHPIKLFYEYDPGNPGIALSDVKTLVQSDHIVALIDGDSEDDASFYSYIIKQPVAIYIQGFDSLQMAASPDQFSVAVSQYYLFSEIMLAAKKVGGHKMAVLYCAENPACAQTVAPLKAAGKTFGIPVVFDASVLDSAPNYVAQCLAAKQAGADVMFIADSGSVSEAVAASCAQQGYTPHQVSDEGAYDQDVAGKPGWNGFLGTQDNVPFYVTSTPGTKLMHDVIQQYEPSVLSNPQWNITNEFLWTTGLLIAQGAKAGDVGTTSPLSGPALIAGMYTLHSTNLGGMVPTLTFVKGVPEENHCWFWAGIANGKWNLPFGLSTTCAPYMKV